jgi:hypothetical protein
MRIVAHCAEQKNDQRHARPGPGNGRQPPDGREGPAPQERQAVRARRQQQTKQGHKQPAKDFPRTHEDLPGVVLRLFAPGCPGSCDAGAGVRPARRFRNSPYTSGMGCFFEPTASRPFCIMVLGRGESDTEDRASPVRGLSLAGCTALTAGTCGLPVYSRFSRCCHMPQKISSNTAKSPVSRGPTCRIRRFSLGRYGAGGKGSGTAVQPNRSASARCSRQSPLGSL